MRKLAAIEGILTAVMIVNLLGLFGCGASTTSSSAGDPPPSTAFVSQILPKNPTVQVGLTLQFTANVQNDAAHLGVTWAVMPSSEANCSGTACGTVDSSGKYTAPSQPHDAPGVLITATSAANPASSSTVVLFVTPAPTGIGVAPAAATVPTGGSLRFTATGDPFGTIPVVTWSVSGAGCSGSSCGTIDSSGEYSAPATAPNPSLVSVTATSQANPAIFGTSAVDIGNGANNAKLNGHYAFLLSGYDGDGAVGTAGALVADGNGNITSGTLDDNELIGSSQNHPISGHYSVTSDGRASLTLATTLANGAPVTRSFSVALGSFVNGVATSGRMAEVDGFQIYAAGVLAKQDPTAFSTAAVDGDYAFGFSGRQSPGAYPSVAAGRFTAHGGTISAGELDLNTVNFMEGGTPTPRLVLDQPFTATYSVSSMGRGSAVFSFGAQDLGFSKFVFYVVSTSELLFLEEEDPCPVDVKCVPPGEIGGIALKQSGGPFSLASMHGSSVFSLTGTPSQFFGADGPVSIGRVTFDGKGALNGKRDENDGGVITSDLAFTGSYTVDSKGRATITEAGNSNPKILYLVGAGSAFFVDTGSIGSGMFEAQSGEPFSNGSFSGTYVVGSTPWPDNFEISPISGLATSNGSGGLVEITDGTSGTGRTTAGSYSVDASGRATLELTLPAPPSNMIFYLISPSKLVGIDLDPNVSNIAVQTFEK